MSEEEKQVKESVLIGWKALEYQRYERDLPYYLVAGLILLVIIGYAVYSQDWFMLTILVLITGLLVWYQRKEPQEKTYRITQLGIYDDDRFYQYNEIFSYWFLVEKNYRTLNIIFAKKFLPQLTILLGDTDPVKVRDVLSKYIPEENTRTENILDRLLRIFRL